MPVCKEDLDKAIAEVPGTLDGVEEISAELRENIVNYIQRRDTTAGLADRLDGKPLLSQILPGIWGRWATHDIYVVPKCCLFQCSNALLKCEVQSTVKVFFNIVRIKAFTMYFNR